MRPTKQPGDRQGDLRCSVSIALPSDEFARQIDRGRGSPQPECEGTKDEVQKGLQQIYHISDDCRTM